MQIEQIYTGCLAQGAYYIESGGEVAIIDPLREVKPYLERAKRDNAKIKYIFETHFHADFVSGHVTLSKQSGAPIVYGPKANPSFDAIVASDNQVFELGDVKIKVLHTPGHTLESTTYLLLDEEGNEHAIFTGDTLFLGDVGRPDLAQKSANITKEDLAGILYDSLRNKIMPLPDHVTVYPAHGAGSACGKNMMKETVDTLGNQKKVNYALRAMDKQQFIKEVTEDLLPPPQYFPHNVKLNKEGYNDIDQVLEQGKKALDPKTFEAVANESGAVVLDVRPTAEFARGHVPRSIFIGLDGSFAPWVGALLGDVAQPILLVTEPGREEETITRLSRVGFDNVLGYLEGSFQSWESSGREIDKVDSITASEFLRHSSGSGATVFDVRKPGEYEAGHFEGATNTPLDFINVHIGEFPKKGSFYVHCAGGYRSMIAASILKSRGIHDFKDIQGGSKAMEEAGVLMATH